MTQKKNRQKWGTAKYANEANGIGRIGSRISRGSRLKNFLGLVCANVDWALGIL